MFTDEGKKIKFLIAEPKGRNNIIIKKKSEIHLGGGLLETRRKADIDIIARSVPKEEQKDNEGGNCRNRNA